MNLPLVTLALAATATLAPAPAASDEAPWFADYDAAVTQAKREGKDLLIDFTGSDWCGYCIRLDKEVFAHEEFLGAVTDDYVLVALDFPRGDEAKARVPDPERNLELKQKYGISGFPTILLVTADGDAYAQTGYQPGGPTKYVEHLEELRASGRGPLMAAMEMEKQFNAADDAGKRELLGGILTLMSKLDAGSPVAARLAGPARTAYAMDPENEAGLKLRATVALLKAGVEDEAVIDAALEHDPHNAKGALELVALARLKAVGSDESLGRFCDVLDRLLASKHPIQDGDLARVLSINGALWAAEHLDEPERAGKYARYALNLGLDEEQAELEARLEEIVAAAG